VNSEQAKEILLLYRPGMDEAEDPDFAAALELSRREPQLAEWFRQHREFQQAMCSRFQQIAVPEGLKEQILSERKSATTASRRQTLMVAGFSAAVFCAVLLVLTLHHRQPGEDNSFAHYRAMMIGKVRRDYPKMDIETNNLEAIHTYLAAQGRGDYVLTPGLAQSAGTGCAVFDWHQKKVTMVCFNSGRNGPGKTPDVFLFVVDASALNHVPQTNQAQVETINRLPTATWSAGGKVYMLTASGDEQFLRHYF